MDAQAQQNALVTRSSIAALVLARGTDLALVELTGKPDVVDQSAALINAGFKLYGLVGRMADGSVEIAPNSPLDVECMFVMGGAVRLFCSLMPEPQKVDDSASWLERLYALPDMRSEFGLD